MTKQIVYLDDSNFQSTVNEGVTLVDFYADWCGPCRMITPIIEELSVEFNGQAKIAKLDVEKAPNTTSTLGVTSIPTIILFSNGKELKRIVGVRDKEFLKSLIASAF